MLQELALSVLKSGGNVFLTGSAGAGKTHLLNRYIRYLRARDAKVAVTASTGIAATHIGGTTIHSWSGLGVRNALGDQDLEAIAKKKPVRERVRNARVLVIDEISMLSAQTLGCVDQILRHLKKSSRPFGGIQVVFCGDFFQLPPVNREGLPAHRKLAFMAPAWLQAGLKLCYLSEVHRHRDDDLFRLLNEIRSGEVSSACRDKLAEKLEEGCGRSHASAIKLHTHNANVDAANARRLEELPGPVRSFEALTAGASQAIVEALKKSAMAPESLQLKKQAQVMFVKNNPDESYINGTLGTVVDFSNDGLPVVRTFRGDHITARTAVWSVVSEQGQIMASYTQVPLRLAWAITVHKSQGMTLDRVTVDLSKTFEPGQGYVALSRVKTWDGLQLAGCNRQALQVDALVLKADLRFQALSAQAQDEISALSEQELSGAFERHVLQCGGTTDPQQIERNEEQLAGPEPGPAVRAGRARASRSPAGPDTYEQTRVLIEAGNSLAEIAVHRGLTRGTIISHLEKIQNHPGLDISRFKPPQEVLDTVCAAIARCREAATDDDLDRRGHLKLSTVYRELNRKYDYREIQLARIFCAPAPATEHGA